MESHRLASDSVGMDMQDWVGVQELAVVRKSQDCRSAVPDKGLAEEDTQPVVAEDIQPPAVKDIMAEELIQVGVVVVVPHDNTGWDCRTDLPRKEGLA